MSASALPSKLFFRIGEVASLVGVEPHVLRYWEREFRSIRPTKSAKGQRVYSRKDVENLLRVRDLLYRDGFTIAGAKKRLQRGAVEPATALLQGTPATQLAEDAASAIDDETEVDAEESVALAAADTDPEIDDEDEVSLAEPASGPRSPRPRATVAHGDVRAKLSALRIEVESFLVELESGEHP